MEKMRFDSSSASFFQQQWSYIVGYEEKWSFIKNTKTFDLCDALVCSGIAKNAKNASAKSLGTVHDVYNEGEPSVGLFD